MFERAYAPAPHSSFSLCSLMTSEYLHETLDLGHPAPQATLPRLLAAAGYHTAAFYTQGIFHTAGERLAGYEREAFGFALHDQVTYTAEELTDRALAEIDRVVARGEQSSLLWVHYFDVHEPYRSTHFGSGDMERYDSEILHVDRELERLIRGARERLSRDVIVVIASDHGEEFHEHGGVYHGSTLYEEQVRVPLIVQAKGLAPRRVADAVSTLDITPTLLGLLGLPSEPQMRGRDLRPLALGQPQPTAAGILGGDPQAHGRALAVQADRGPALRALRALRPRARPARAREPRRSAAGISSPRCVLRSTAGSTRWRRAPRRRPIPSGRARLGPAR